MVDFHAWVKQLHRFRPIMHCLSLLLLLLETIKTDKTCFRLLRLSAFWSFLPHGQSSTCGLCVVCKQAFSISTNAFCVQVDAVLYTFIDCFHGNGCTSVSSVTAPLSLAYLYSWQTRRPDRDIAFNTDISWLLLQRANKRGLSLSLVFILGRSSIRKSDLNEICMHLASKSAYKFIFWKS